MMVGRGGIDRLDQNFVTYMINLQEMAVTVISMLRACDGQQYFSDLSFEERKSA